MTERKWTPSQLEAINFSGKNVILSAAAGSGKTATLTQRIIRLLTDPAEGAELSRMLIVTFTVAAAGELRSRIADALNAAISKDPENTFLVRQLSGLEGAHISTIDSFFKSELKPYFTKLGLPFDFSILDEAQVAILKKSAMEETISDLMEGRGECAVEDFCILADCISTARNEADLCESLLSICASLQSYDMDEKKLVTEAEDLEKHSDDFFGSDHCISLKSHIKDLAEHYTKRFQYLSDTLGCDENTAKYVPETLVLLSVCKNLSSIAEMSYKEASNIFASIEFPRLSPIKKGCSTDDYELFKAVRSDFKDEIAALKEDFFSQSENDIAHAMTETAKNIRTLASVNNRFTKTYSDKKRERGCVDFSDLSAFARQIFVNEDGSPTEAAEETGKKFDYVFIDEYQDTNFVQDSVFFAISKNSKRFLVGDVKQSIYGFRGSRPDIFFSYRDRFSKENDSRSIFMSENFRSDKCVIDFSNIVSRHIFFPDSTPFEKEDELVCSKIGGNSENLCEVILVEKEEEGEDPLPTEAECVAARISELLSNGKLSDGSSIRPKDVAILLRSGTNADQYVRALAALGICANNSASEEFFAYGEVLLILCLLNSADNPLRDIYLAGAMKSPVFNFTLNDLVNIRTSTNIPLWYSLCDYCENGSDSELLEKCRCFKKTVDKWRSAASELYCDEVLRLIISDTSLRTYGGDGVRNNSDVIRSIKILSDQAKSMAENKGSLHEFIVHLNSMIERKDRSAVAADPNSVSILTIHRSKGLEYPVCFLCETSKKFNTRDAAEKLLCSSSGMIGMKLYDKSGLVRCDNPVRRAVALKMRDNCAEEEARILYVAMTRAREKLIVTCKVKSIEEKLSLSSAKAAFPLDNYDIRTTQTYGDWMIDALQRSDDTSSFIYKKGADIIPQNAYDEYENAEIAPELTAFFEKSLDFSYDKEYLWNIPSKLSVSVLKPDILGSDEERSYFDRPSVITMAEKAPVPDFLQEEKRISAADRGIATHVFMQFCDFEELYEKGADAELERLLAKKFISKKDAEIVRLEEIELFRKSDVFSRLRTAKSLMRERRFNTILPAADFTTDKELKEKLSLDGITITVQGVVDCIFTDKDGKTVLVDYKTDRLTKEELADESLAAKKLLLRHSRQLLIYKNVCEKMIGRPFDEVLIYSLHLGKAIKVD